MLRRSKMGAKRKDCLWPKAERPLSGEDQVEADIVRPTAVEHKQKQHYPFAGAHFAMIASTTAQTTLERQYSFCR